MSHNMKYICINNLTYIYIYIYIYIYTYLYNILYIIHVCVYNAFVRNVVYLCNIYIYIYIYNYI